MPASSRTNLSKRPDSAGQGTHLTWNPHDAMDPQISTRIFSNRSLDASLCPTKALPMISELIISDESSHPMISGKILSDESSHPMICRTDHPSGRLTEDCGRSYWHAHLSTYRVCSNIDPVHVVKREIPRKFIFEHRIDLTQENVQARRSTAGCRASA